MLFVLASGAIAVAAQVPQSPVPLTEVQRLERRISELETVIAQRDFTILQKDAQIGDLSARLAQAIKPQLEAGLKDAREALVAKWRRELKAPDDADFDGNGFVPKPKKQGQ